jgi:CRP-like cAMP-binding protein
MQHLPSEFHTRLEEQLAAWNLPAELANEIEEHSTPVAFEKGAIIFLREAPADLVFWLRKGFVKLYLPHADGNRGLIAIARPGDPIGMVATVDADGCRHQIFEAQALTKCSLSLLSREQLTNLLRKLDRERVIQLLDDLNATWSALYERSAKFIGLAFRERLEIVFADLGARFGTEDRRGTLILPVLSQEDLAEMIGSARPMVSKLVGEMIQEGLLERTKDRQFILLSQAGRQSKLASSLEVTPGKAARASKFPSRSAVRSSTPTGGNQSRVALSAMNQSYGRHNV